MYRGFTTRQLRGAKRSRLNGCGKRCQSDVVLESYSRERRHKDLYGRAGGRFEGGYLCSHSEPSLSLRLMYSNVVSTPPGLLRSGSARCCVPHCLPSAKPTLPILRESLLVMATAGWSGVELSMRNAVFSVFLARSDKKTSSSLSVADRNVSSSLLHPQEFQ